MQPEQANDRHTYGMDTHSTSSSLLVDGLTKVTVVGLVDAAAVPA